MTTEHTEKTAASAIVDSVLTRWKECWAEEGRTVSDATMNAARAVMIRTVPVGADEKTAEDILDGIFAEGMLRDEEWVIEAAKECGLHLFNVVTGTPTWPPAWVDAYTRLKAELPDANMVVLRDMSSLYIAFLEDKDTLGARRALASHEQDGLFPDSWVQAAGGRSGAELADIMAG